ncbi:MAG: ABC transporter ATP-binding protein [Clostridia bacterium]|nr:ABC transporter ATP-binding protein [Clostridia bacterium]
MDTIIEVKDVSMRFRMANDNIRSIKEYAVQMLKGKIQYNEFEALKHVSFDVKRGEVVGLIGHNGAGKSTMLKVISGILKPTEGSVTVRGNIAPMLELGSGFDFDMTGRENIFLNGAILGYSEEFLNSKYDEIVQFSEIGQFIDIPLRNYSSGMIARLAFSIATVVVPEVLIVDEVLSVGDAAFQEKSYKRMMELMHGGTTVLFVSHNMKQVREMCNRVVWLEHGCMKGFGETEVISSEYESCRR